MANSGNHVMVHEVLAGFGEQQSRRVDPADRPSYLEFEGACAGDRQLAIGRNSARRKLRLSDDLLCPQALARDDFSPVVLPIRSAAHSRLLSHDVTAAKSRSTNYIPPSTGS